MIYDCFTFFNELELLELRLNELAGVVDRFVLVEATQTHTNKSKPLHYQENRARFSEFHDKIIHIVVDDLPVSSDPWVPENFQRNCIARGLTKCRPDDFVLVSDLDEIPRASVVAEMTRKIPYHDNALANAVHGTLNSKLSQNIFKRKGFRRLLRKNHPFVWKFEQVTYVHYINCLSTEISRGTRMTRFRDFSCAEELRHSGRNSIKNAGWHFTWMGGAERIRDKLEAYSHQECNLPQFNNPDHINRILNKGSTLFKEDVHLKIVPLDDSFPGYVLTHPEKFSHWLKMV
jgi:beta-1,4-mannosyl-glycoprotein beta-1,4-N-acetylglucosaminyltransferase